MAKKDPPILIRGGARPPTKLPGEGLPPVELKAPLSDDDRDTEADSPEAAEGVRRRRTGRAAPREPTKAREPETVIDEGPPIREVAKGRLSDVLRHETKVRRRASMLAERRGSSSSGGPRSGFEIELARSLDASQQISRVGPDRVRIEGMATGALDDGERAPTVSVMVDGTLYAVGVEAGDTAAETADRLVARMSRGLRAEVVERGDEHATVLVRGSSGG